MINIKKLTQELQAAGITTHGNCNSNGVVWDDNNNEIQDRADVKAIINAHDPAPDSAAVQSEEYSKAGITPEKIAFALWDHIIKGDNTAAAALQSLMEEIDSQIN